MSGALPAHVPAAKHASAPGLRILSVCQTLPTPANPGAGVFVLNRLRAMRELAAVDVLQPVPFFPGVRPSPSWAAADSHASGDMQIHHQPMFYLPGVLKSLDSRWMERSIRTWIRRHAVTNPVDIIDAHFGYPDGVACTRAARRLGLPVFVTVRGHETDFIKLPLIGNQLREALNGATGCISVSHSLRDLLVRHGVRAGQMTVIPNAVDRAVFRPGDRAAARQALGLPVQTPLIVSVGHLISGKRHHILVQALQQLLKSQPDIKLAIIGGAAYQPQYPAQLRKLVGELGLDERVRFVDRVPPAQVAQWLQAADVFALMTEREGCCNAVLEALASGLPVVTTPVGDNAHFISEGRNGFLVPVDDPLAASSSLDRALGQQWDSARISRELTVGSWSQTGAAVIDFMQARLALRTPMSGVAS